MIGRGTNTKPPHTFDIKYERTMNVCFAQSQWQFNTLMWPIMDNIKQVQ